MKVIPVKCPRCGKPAYSKVKDQLVFCEDCKTLHTRTDAGPAAVEHEVAEFRREMPGLRKLHAPFWRLFSSVTIHSEKVQGAWVSKLLSAASGAGRGGTLFIFVPAFDLPPQEFKRWASELTVNPPQYRGVEGFTGDRIPSTVTEENARMLADFLILSFEAEKPGVLQDIKYDVAVQHSKLIYLPFYHDGANYQLGL